MHKLNTAIASRINRSLVLSLIHENPHISRAQISARSGLDRSTITHILNYLLKEKLVKESEKGKSSSRGGRCPIPLSVHYNARTLAVIEVGMDTIQTQLTNLRGDEICRWSFPFKRGAPLIDLLSHQLDDMRKTAEKDFMKCIVIGISCPGIVDAQKGIIRYNKYHRWRDVEIVAPLEAQLGKSVFVENDANAAAVGELNHSEGVEHRSLLYLLIRNAPPESEQILGVGGAIIFNGRLWHGVNYFAGEVADTVNEIFSRGSVRAWRDKTTQLLGIQKRTLKHLLESAAQKEPDAVAAADEIGEGLGRFMAETAAFFDPGSIMIYVNLRQDGYDLIEKANASFKQHVPAFYSETCFLSPVLNEAAILRGLIALAQERVFVRDGIHHSLLFQ